MLKKETSPEQLALTPLTVKLPDRVVNDLKQMESFSKHSVDELVTKALLMFIATHSDYLGKK